MFEHPLTYPSWIHLFIRIITLVYRQSFKIVVPSFYWFTEVLYRRQKISTPKMDCHCYYSHYYPFCKQLKLYSHLKQGVKMLLLHNWTWQWERLWRRFKWKRKNSTHKGRKTWRQRNIKYNNNVKKTMQVQSWHVSASDEKAVLIRWRQDKSQVCARQKQQHFKCANCLLCARRNYKKQETTKYSRDLLTQSQISPDTIYF